MEQNSQENTAPESSDANTEIETPVRRRASRRATAAAGEAVVVEATPGESAASEPVASSPAADQVAPAEPAAPKKRVSRARKKVDESDDVAGVSEPVASASEPAAGEGEPDVAQSAADAAQASAEAVQASEAPAKRTRSTTTTRRRQPAAAAAAESAATDSAASQSESRADSAGSATSTDSAAATDSAASSTSGSTESKEATAGESADSEAAPASRRRNTRARGRKVAAEASGDTSNAETAKTETSKTETAAGEESNQAQGSAGESQTQTEKAENGSANRGPSNGNSNDNQQRSNRTRQRERKRRGSGDDEPEITEDDVLLPVAGILDVLDNYAFVRTSGYLPGTNDVYVSLGQVKKYGMRRGDAIVGAIRQPREGDGGGRQKYNAIVKVDSINSKPTDEQQTRSDFAELTPIYPTERLRVETDATEAYGRAIDLFAPIGKGQRGLVIGPHESGKSTALQKIAHAVAKNDPEAHLMLVLVDERPEEVTALQRTINGEVIASTFDRPAEDHTTVVELAIERAKRLVELGHDVVVLIDSLTGLARAHNLSAPASVRVPAGSLDAAAIFPVKRVLSAARNIENGGSLTIIATVSAQPDSRLDEALLGELEGVANMQLRLSGDAADRRIFPALDVQRSSTRHDELLTSESEVNVLGQVRQSLQEENGVQGLERVLQQFARTSSNVEFLALAQRNRA